MELVEIDAVGYSTLVDGLDIPVFSKSTFLEESAYCYEVGTLVLSLRGFR